MDEDRKPGAVGTGDSLKESLPASRARDAEDPAPDSLPHGLRQRLDASADDWCQSGHSKAAVAPCARERHVVDRHAQRRGWYLAAACFVLAIVGWWPRLAPIADDAVHGISPLQADAERGREHLLKAGSDHLGRWSWTHESGLVADVRGEVVWDSERQEGYLTLVGPGAQCPGRPAVPVVDLRCRSRRALSRRRGCVRRVGATTSRRRYRSVRRCMCRNQSPSPLRSNRSAASSSPTAVT